MEIKVRKDSHFEAVWFQIGGGWSYVVKDREIDPLLGVLEHGGAILIDGNSLGEGLEISVANGVAVFRAMALGAENAMDEQIATVEGGDLKQIIRDIQLFVEVK